MLNAIGACPHPSSGWCMAVPFTVIVADKNTEDCPGLHGGELLEKLHLSPPQSGLTQPMTCWHGIQKVSPLAPMRLTLSCHLCSGVSCGITLKLISTDNTSMFAIFPALFCFLHLPFNESIFPIST